MRQDLSESYCISLWLLTVSRTRHGARSDNGWRTVCFCPDQHKIVLPAAREPVGTRVNFGSALGERQPGCGTSHLARQPCLCACSSAARSSGTPTIRLFIM